MSQNEALGVADVPSEPGGSTSFWRRLLLTNEFGLILLIVLFTVIFATLAPAFVSRFSLFAMGRTMAIDIVIGFSMMVVIVTGGLNLSVGAIAVCAVMFCGWLIESLGLPLPVAILGALAMGSALGWINGILIVKSGIHSFIITLATMSIFFGVMIFLTRAEAFRALPPEVAAFGKAKIGGYLSPLLLVTVVVMLALAYLYSYTALGRRMLAAGASPAAAELSGIQVNRTFVACHVLSGLLATVAGLMLTARTGAAIPSMAGHLGQDWLLPAFLAPVLGGTLLSGGRVSVVGTFLGGALVTVLSAGLLLMQVGEFWVKAVLGLLLLLAVFADKARRVYLAKKEDGMTRLFKQDWFGLLAVVVVACAVITVLKPAFLSSYNLQILLASIAINAMIVFSQAIIIAIGQMNLSIGAIGGLAAISFAGAMEVWGLPVPLAAALGLAIGLAAGLLNGWLVAASGISAFIITLATLYIFNGITLGITEAQPFYGISESVKAFGDAILIGPVPMIAVPTLLVTVAMIWMLTRMRIGRHILAVGGNPHAAELGGVSVRRTVIWAHAISGVLAALAGMIVVARLQIGQPTIGNDWLITSFAAPVIGGALLQGGHLSVIGTLLGVVIIAIITQGLVLFGVDPFAMQIALGGLILWAVAIDRTRSYRAERNRVKIA